MVKLKYDRDRLDFIEEKRSFGYYLLKGAVFLLFTSVLVALYYLVFSLIINTKEQKRMVAETRIMSQEFDRLRQQADLLENVLTELENKDQYIYNEIFNSKIPDMTFAMDTVELSDLSVSGRDFIVTYTANRVRDISSALHYCDSLIASISGEIAQKEVRERIRNIPSLLPIPDFPLQNIGASIGKKMHPFYKSVVFHPGLDFIAPTGTDVVATAKGVVESVVRSKTSQGTMIVIDHGNGYRTTYSHLSDILVKKGRTVKAGQKIARVGNSGTSFAPHLHYEVLFDGVHLDPLNFFMLELDIDEYRDLIMVAVNTGQSLD